MRTGRGVVKRHPGKRLSMSSSAFCSRNKYLTQSPYKGKANFDSVDQVSVSDGGFGSRDIYTCVSLRMLPERTNAWGSDLEGKNHSPCISKRNEGNECMLALPSF